MGGRLALSKADVTNAAGTVTKDVSVQVLGSLLRLYEGGLMVAEVDGVADVSRTGQRTWSLAMVDGSTWQVVRGKGCSTCGGGR